MTQEERVRPCRGGVVTSVIRFLQIHSEKLPADVIKSSLNIIHHVCCMWEPHDEHVREWVGSLSSLLSHRDYDYVVKMTIKVLQSIFEHFIFCGCDFSSVLTDDLIANLSRHLFKASRTFDHIHETDIPLYHYPPLLEMAKLYSINETENRGKHGFHLLPLFWQMARASR